MRRVWVSILTVWALVALVAVLAWAHRPGAVPVAGASQAVVVKGAGGATHVVLVPAGGVHGTTQTSPGAAAAAPTPISLTGGTATTGLVQAAPAGGGQ